MWSADYPGGINNYEIDKLGIKPDVATNCYEHTMTVNFSDSAVPSIKDLLSTGFRGVRISGKTAIIKGYFWAYTENGAERSEVSCKSLLEQYHRYMGNIVSSSYKNLGPEVNNIPIEF